MRDQCQAQHFSLCDVCCSGTKEACFSVFRQYLHGADHGTKGEYGSGVSQRGLAVECSLCVHQQHCHLEVRRRNTNHTPVTIYLIQDSFHSNVLQIVSFENRYTLEHVLVM